MEADLLTQIVVDAGSIRRASKLIEMPRSTLGAKLARARRWRRWSAPHLRPSHRGGVHAAS